MHFSQAACKNIEHGQCSPINSNDSYDLVLSEEWVNNVVWFMKKLTHWFLKFHLLRSGIAGYESSPNSTWIEWGKKVACTTEYCQELCLSHRLHTIPLSHSCVVQFKCPYELILFEAWVKQKHSSTSVVWMNKQITPLSWSTSWIINTLKMYHLGTVWALLLILKINRFNWNIMRKKTGSFSQGACKNTAQAV